jgi:uncharacterized membrane protein YraQ (UPF0718 family)
MSMPRSHLADQAQPVGPRSPLDSVRVLWGSLAGATRELKILALFLAGFVILFFLPIEAVHFGGPAVESVRLARWYAREHVLLCLVPAFFIAGAVGVFVSQAAVMKYLGSRANPVMAYAVASVSGTILAVCSCTVLPLFAGIHTRGAGLGPATAFLYSGPAINVLAIVLTARVLGLEMGVARAVGAIVFSVVVGVLMHFLFRREERERSEGALALPEPEATRPLWQTAIHFALMVGILVFVNWGRPDVETGLWHAVWVAKWKITAALAALFCASLTLWFGVPLRRVLLAAAPAALLAIALPAHPVASFAAGCAGLCIALAGTEGEPREWLIRTWDFTKQILPLLFAGVLLAGFLLGTPAMDGRAAGGGLVPSAWIAGLVGGNSLAANFFASVVGAFMYFATLTEVPILEGLLHAGMGKGPALALLLAGPSLSLPSMLVIRSILGTRKTVTYVLLVVAMATITGLIYGAFAS